MKKRDKKKRTETGREEPARMTLVQKLRLYQQAISRNARRREIRPAEDAERG